MSFDKSPRGYRRIGLMGAGALALVAALIMALTLFPFGKDTYTAELEHTAGLRVGEEVQVAGVGVGEVRKIELDGKRVRIEFTVDKSIELGKETTAEVKVATLLGTHFLLVSPQGGGELAAQNVPLAQTRVPFNLQDVLNETGDLSQKLDVKAITKSLDEISTTMDASREEFVPALRGISDVSQMFAERSDDLATLLKSTSTFSEQLNSNSDDITQLLKQANVLMTELTSRRTSIHNLLVDLRAVGTELTTLMTENREDVGPMLDNLNATITLLTKNHKKLGEIAETLGPTARYFANSTGSGSWLDQYMPEATPDGIRCKLEGKC
ncbi:phospholipid/cholesterol/gamma-HCH transport system substrate-binding protein [Nocardioides daedukensis]|uniref:Phospholipid/cholesterol/gamma-HCH transport system substrate-binding protein n=1 Tax=Nocardioides daedukensis TaxID=634462 RepID=A0A7Y9RYK6_9ACTN|nr:MCE family protein [Nocardioides daedukensis]NYG57796.1 phospholipid/cholesterol/gamma-HCH transport system substrate-binding protein [Nocardioides daedukensis]